MLSLLIAEDDRETREGLYDCVKWSEYGIEVVKTVSNGLAASEYMQTEGSNVDILLTDIKMPLMDGVELVRHMRETGCRTKTIIITAYWEKGYLKSAFEYGVSDYILKPIKLDELDKVLRKVSRECNDEKNRHERYLLLEQKLTESMPALRERMIGQLLAGKMKGEEYIRSRLLFAEIPFFYDDWFSVLCINFSFKTRANNLSAQREDELLFLSATDKIRKVTEGHFETYLHFTGENECVYILAAHTRAGYKKQLDFALEIQKVLSTTVDGKIAIGISHEVRGIDNMHNSYLEAVRALEHKFFLGDNAVIHCEDINRHNTIQNFRPDILQEKLVQQVRLGCSIQVHEYLNQLFGILKDTSGISMEYIQNICLEIVIDLEKQLLDIIPGYELNRDEFIWKDIFSLKTLDELKEWMHFTLDGITGTIYDFRKNSIKTSVKKIMDIISERYMEELTIQSIADEMYLTPNYLSLLFKKNTGKTINEYITKVRMEKAMELLKDPLSRVFEVSQAVGYKNPDYFTRIFKRYVGVNPVEYKERPVK